MAGISAGHQEGQAGKSLKAFQILCPRSM